MEPDRQARADLRSVLLGYMTGEIRTRAFSRQNLKYFDERKPTDSSVIWISWFLYNIHDDFTDHPILVGPEVWAVLRRIVAFLGTDLDAASPFEAAFLDLEHPSWPFSDAEQWHACEHLLDEVALPQYDPALHSWEVWRSKTPCAPRLVGIPLMLAGILVLTAFVGARVATHRKAPGDLPARILGEVFVDVFGLVGVALVVSGSLVLLAARATTVDRIMDPLMRRMLLFIATLVVVSVVVIFWCRFWPQVGAR